LTIHGDGGEKINFKALNTTTGEVKSISQTMPFAVNDIKGTFELPVVLTFGLENSASNSNGEALVYPNPVNDVFTIILPDDGFAHALNFTDMTGRLLKKAEAPAGILKVDLSIKDDNIATGVYLLSIEGGNSTKTIKIIKN
jgi:hypothetical protein